MVRNDAEHRLQCALADHLRLQAPRDCWWTAVPNGGYRSKRTAGRLKASGVNAGSPDLIFVYQGRFYGLELKVKGGRQSDVQSYVAGLIYRADGTYRIATGIDEALAALREWGILPESYRYEPASRRQLSLMESG